MCLWVRKLTASVDSFDVFPVVNGRKTSVVDEWRWNEMVSVEVMIVMSYSSGRRDRHLEGSMHTQNKIDYLSCRRTACVIVTIRARSHQIAISFPVSIRKPVITSTSLKAQPTIIHHIQKIYYHFTSHLHPPSSPAWPPASV